MIRFTASAFTVDAAQDDSEPKRTITGIAAPYNVTATVSGGQMVKILPGALPVEGKNPKLYMSHDSTQAIGVVTERVDTPEAMLFTAKISATTLGDEALILAADGVLDSVSVGINPTKYKMQGKVMVVEAADWLELSLVPQPAFAGAQITDVAASIPQNDEQVCQNADTVDLDSDTEETEQMESAPEIIEANPVITTVFAQAKKEVKLPTAAEYLAAAIAGGSAWHEMSAALKAAAPDVVTTDTPGILPTPILGPVYNNFVGRRPVVDAIGVKAMPGGGKIFIRPEVTTNTSMAVQSAENAALQSGTFVVYNNQVTKATYGGYVTISEQDLDWTDPAVLSLILDDMSRIYANTTDNVAADNLLAGCSQSAVLTDPTSAAEWVSDIYTAASTILSNSNGNLPTHLFLSPNMFSYLGQLVDTAGRPLFPQVGPMNAFGTMSPGSADAVAFGLRVVVDRNFAADTVIVGDASGFEIFEQQKGALSIDNPSTISRTIAWRGYFATLMIDATKFVKLT